MNCPSCLSIMYCDTEIHTVDDKTQRMDLHCNNQKCPCKNVNYQSFMGVLVRPNEMWECYSYNLPFQYKDKWYSLEGYNFPFRKTTRIYQLSTDQVGWTPISGGGAYNNKALILLQSSVVEMGFIPLSTSDDMHLEASKLFNRLMNLVAYT